MRDNNYFYQVVPPQLRLFTTVISDTSRQLGRSQILMSTFFIQQVLLRQLLSYSRSVMLAMSLVASSGIACIEVSEDFIGLSLGVDSVNDVG